MKQGRRIFLSTAFAMTACAAVATHALAAPYQIRSGLDLRDRLGLSGQSGWMVIDMDTGQVLEQHNAARAFVPASVAKLPTAAFALDALGHDHRFQTRLLAKGTVKSGQLRGDLILSGGGDPELDTDALARLARGARDRGIRSVDGTFYADGTLLPQLSEIDPRQGEDASYNPSVSGLNLNFNRVHVKWDARKGRKALTVEAVARNLSPQVDGIRVAVASSPGQPLFSLSRQGGREVWEMSQEAFRGRAARWLPVKRPEAYAGEVFRTVARDNGLVLEAAQLPRSAQGGDVVATHQSRPLGAIARDMLRYSTNLTAEVLGCGATRSVGMGVGSLSDSAAVMNAWAASVAGFAPGDTGFVFANHSGLSLDSKVSPQRMVQLLAALARRSSPAAGRHARLPGSIAGYLKEHNVKDEKVPIDYQRLDVVAKTGTMNYVRGLAGYVATPGGRRLAFAIFSNDIARRANGHNTRKRWMGKARSLERALIRNWVLTADKSG